LAEASYGRLHTLERAHPCSRGRLARCITREHIHPGRGDDHNAEHVVGSLEGFPRWMWRNTDISDFVTWLREFNRESQRGIGFYGLDLYRLNRSIEAVLAIP
jgi:hypothetical protein